MGFVVVGTGNVTLAGKDKEKTSTIDFRPEDFFVFKPKTFHGWQVVNEEWVGVWV